MNKITEWVIPTKPAYDALEKRVAELEKAVADLTKDTKMLADPCQGEYNSVYVNPPVPINTVVRSILHHLGLRVHREPARAAVIERVPTKKESKQ